MTSSRTFVARLLDAADELLEAKPRSAAFRRRAVSTCYYAVFHALAKLCTQTLLDGIDAQSPAYVRVYRSLDHGPIKNAFSQAPLKDHAELQRLGGVLSRLQSERMRADYLPADPHLLSEQEVRELMAQARAIVDDLSQLAEPEKLLLATCLMFKTR